MKLEIGMYVRTNDGYINKIKKVNQFNVLVYGRDLFGEELNIPNNEITKASYNIIDILEKGDMVNSLIVTRISEDNETNKKYINLYGSICEWENEDIKSVITHEQMEQVAYKVGD